uniref:FAD-binding domain-containing protein n=1 Tax=Bionectria ochroleuca TaxID=29856 RepID=A0A8H7N2X0_BIOOC
MKQHTGSNMVKHIDVLIVGAGPSGLTAANCFNGSDLTVRIIDKKPGPDYVGKADGIKSISIEVLDSLGIGDAVFSESQRVEEIVLWNPDENGTIERTMTIPDRVEELMKPREVCLDQGRVEGLMVENLKKHGSVQISWNTQPVDLKINTSQKNDPEAYPVTISLENTNTGMIETLAVKYIVGGDGAHSWLRKQLGINLTGDLTDSTWGVLNMVPKTDFPDIRKVFVVHSVNGTVMGVPRESKMVRFYISMDGGSRHTSINVKDITAENIIEAAQIIMAPYKLEAARIPWWSAYCVGQRVADRFSHDERVFLVGDAVHTHSPKAGQGMNTSLQDGYNIGWKLRYCLEQNASRELLSTYPVERKPVAQALIDFDRAYLETFARSDITHEEFLEAYLAGQRFTTGTQIQYPESLIVKGSNLESTSPLATQLVEGVRLPDLQIVNQSDGVPVKLYHRLTCDGRFRVLVFSGNLSNGASLSRFNSLGDWFEKYLPASSGLEILTIHSSKREEVELMDLHPSFRPWSEDGWDYWAIYADDDSYHDGHGRVYERCGINKEEGCFIVVRPDGYISTIRSLNQTTEILAFFSDLKEGKAQSVQATESLRTRL